MAQGTLKRSEDTQAPPPAPPPTYERERDAKGDCAEVDKRDHPFHHTQRQGAGKAYSTKTIFHETPPYATAPSTFSKNQSLLRWFKTFPAENLPDDCKLSEAVCRYASWSLGNVIFFFCGVPLPLLKWPGSKACTISSLFFDQESLSKKSAFWQKVKS